jgi:lipoprotein-anchoring transpeptidase ErfK/SrfK
MGTNLVRALEPFSPRPVQDILEAQIALARRGLSPGSVDGAEGSQTRAALAAFQRKEKLVATARLDAATKGQLILDAPGLTNYTISLDDLARLVPVSRTWQGKSEQGRLDYENILELVAEKSCSSPKLIRRLNPTVDWDNVTAGMVVVVPDTSLRPAVGASAFVRISLSGRTLDVFDAETNLLAHFPCSIAARVEKRPLGDLHVAAVAHNPNYTFDPDIFPESAEARGLGRKLVLPPGPNNPVGTAWVGLDRAGYGIHGTPRPEEVGRTESHGCFRLANWNAELLARLVSIGTPVLVEY